MWFFSSWQKLNWDDLAQKKVPAPFVPRISNELDVSNFSEEFTAMIPQDSPAIVPPDVEKMFNVSAQIRLNCICICMNICMYVFFTSVFTLLKMLLLCYYFRATPTLLHQFSSLTMSSATHSSRCHQTEDLPQPTCWLVALRLVLRLYCFVASLVTNYYSLPVTLSAAWYIFS